MWSGEWRDSVATPRFDRLTLIPIPTAPRGDQPVLRPEGQVFRRWLRAAPGPRMATAR
ncbi:MAG: hypothetical protein ACE5LF_07210 [Alphaproteobacteria bacterium]